MIPFECRQNAQKTGQINPIITKTRGLVAKHKKNSQQNAPNKP